MNRKTTTVLIALVAGFAWSMVAPAAGQAAPLPQPNDLVLTFDNGQVASLPLASMDDLLAREDAGDDTILRARVDGDVLVYHLSGHVLSMELMSKEKADALFAALTATAQASQPATGAGGPLPDLNGGVTLMTVDTGWNCNNNLGYYEGYCAKSTAEQTCCFWHWYKVNFDAPSNTYYLLGCDSRNGCMTTTYLYRYVHTMDVDTRYDYVCRSYTTGFASHLNVWTRVAKGSILSSTYASSASIDLYSGTWNC